MQANIKLIRKNLDKKLKKFIKLFMYEKQPKSWIRTIREALGMTTTQLAKRAGISQPRIIAMEKNETNLKIKTLEKMADSMDCKLIYMFVPKFSINNSLDQIVELQATRKAKKLMEKINHNMAMENQESDFTIIELDLLKQELLNGADARLWDEDE